MSSLSQVSREYPLDSIAIPSIRPSTHEQEGKTRETLENSYVTVTLAYLALATDDFHHYSAEHVMSIGFNVIFECNMYPRLKTLDERESTASLEIRDLEESMIFAHLGLLTGTEVGVEDIESDRLAAPLLVGRDILSFARVHTLGINTTQRSISELSSIETTHGSRFSTAYIHTLAS